MRAEGRIIALIGGLALSLGGCAPSIHEQVREYNQDGILLYSHRRYEQARQTFAHALTLKPGDPSLLFNLGQCYDRLGNRRKAQQTYKACLREAPNHAGCRYALAGILVSQGKEKEARQMVEQWIQSQPRLSDAYALDGWLWYKAGDLPLAQNRLQQALQLNPRNERALVSLGQVYETLNLPDRALVIYQRALRVNMDQPEVFQKVRLLRNSGARPPRPDL